ncbi:MAG: hypothetical protein LC746_10040 [Acidobacteria bacterium]|nr:hypothetical protein [Acidobacteriota bacterium]
MKNKPAFRIARRIATSRSGQLFFIAHLCLIVFLFSQKQVVGHDPTDCVTRTQWGWDYVLIAGRPFHWHYESGLMKVVFLLDLPACFVGALLLAPVYYLYPNICVYTASWIEAALYLACASVQWWLVGFLIGLSLYGNRNTT